MQTAWRPSLRWRALIAAASGTEFCYYPTMWLDLIGGIVPGAFKFGDVVAARFRAVAVFIVFAAIAISTGGNPLAAEPDLPLLQDESARTAFISGVYKTCLERQRKLRENASLTAPELGQYCLCYGRALADIIDATDSKPSGKAGPPPRAFSRRPPHPLNCAVPRCGRRLKVLPASATW